MFFPTRQNKKHLSVPFMFIKPFLLLVAFMMSQLIFAQTLSLEDLVHVEEPLESLIKKAESGDVKAQLDLSKRYLSWNESERNPQRAIDFLDLASMQGSREAMKLLGKIYYFGESDIPKNRELGIHWLEKAVKAGDPEAAYFLYVFERSNRRGSLYLIELAAKGGLPEAQYKLAKMYLSGSDTPVLIDKAVFWMQASANMNFPAAVEELGMFYRFGIGVPQDFKQAILLLQKAVDLGNFDALLELGRMKQLGLGTPKNEKAAFDIFRSLANTGNLDGFMELANCFQSGIGVPTNLVVANAIYNYEATKFPDYGKAKSLRSTLNTMLSNVEIENSQALTRQMLDSKLPVEVIDQFLAKQKIPELLNAPVRPNIQPKPSARKKVTT